VGKIDTRGGFIFLIPELVLIFAVLWAKLRTKEEWMRSHLAETYAAYLHRTAALVPYLF
jgi:protein-S-isoprenylcysteine O-methyltransferase Ste14